jgi:dCMP deaminase
MRSTCLRRRYGAIIIKNDELISSGYNGSPRRTKNCVDEEICLRQKLNIKPGERYELCRSVHAEANAIISASRKDLIGSTLYLVGIDVKNGETSEHCQPCMMCRRMIINAGIEKVIMLNKLNEYEVRDINSFIEEENSLGDDIK